MILLNSIWLSLFFLNVIYYFWLCWVFTLHKLFSSCGQQGYSLVVVPSHRDGFSCCESQPLEHRLSNSGARVYLPWGTWDLPGLRDRTCVSYIGRQILYHWATREAPTDHFFTSKKDLIELLGFFKNKPLILLYFFNFYRSIVDL